MTADRNAKRRKELEGNLYLCIQSSFPKLDIGPVSDNPEGHTTVEEWTAVIASVDGHYFKNTDRLNGSCIPCGVGCPPVQYPFWSYDMQESSRGSENGIVPNNRCLRDQP
jgi:hypothetical protein